MTSTQILELFAVAIAAAFILSALTRGFDGRRSRNAENGELMYAETEPAARCRKHGRALDSNGQICPDCLIEMRLGIGMQPTREILRGEIRPSWERARL